jgi:hypothetical protein
MRKIIVSLSLYLAISAMSFAQTNDTFAGNCLITAGEKAKYLKDFRIQLGEATPRSELRYKATISLWKNTRYRFTLCSSEDSKGMLILDLKDQADRIVASSFDQETGRTYKFIDFLCSKSGVYRLNYDFTGRHQGSGVGIVSMIK